MSLYVKGGGVGGFTEFIVPTADKGWSGLYLTGKVTSDETIGKCLYLANTGEWVETDASTAGMGSLGIAIEDISAGSSGKIMTTGYIRLDAWSWVAGDEIYLDTTSGLLVKVMPAAPNYVRVVGYAHDSHTIFFCPSQTRIKRLL